MRVLVLVPAISTVSIMLLAQNKSSINVYWQEERRKEQKGREEKREEGKEKREKT